MTKAQLIYTNNLYDSKKNKIILESGSLNFIDACTKNYKNSLDIKKNSIYGDKINTKNPSVLAKDALYVEYIRNNSSRVKLPILVNDYKPIILKDDFYNNILSEVEMSRKLLFNSKNKMYIKSFLKSNLLSKTSDFLIKVSYNEYVDLLSRNVPTITSAGEYYVNVKEVFKYVSEHNKLGRVRILFEDSLEAWKKKISKLSYDGLYFYSRNLRILSNEYRNKLKNNNEIKNLSFNENVILKTIPEYKERAETIEMIKQKILVD